MPETSLQHIAIIMDGNRRWAQRENLTPLKGHLQGVEPIKETIRYCVNHNIPYLTLFAFSTENWKRSPDEVKGLAQLLTSSILKYLHFLISNKVRLHIIGDLKPFPTVLNKAFNKACEMTKKNQGLNLILAINYGGKKEILKGIKTLFADYHTPEKNLDQDLFTSHIHNMKETDFEQHLESSAFPPPDLMIRTGGVQRLSNFYLWSSAYSEIYFSNVLWPEFNTEELKKAIAHYVSMKRRFGI